MEDGVGNGASRKASKGAPGTPCETNGRQNAELL